MIFVSLKGEITQLNEQLDRGAVLKQSFNRHNQALTNSTIIFCLRFAAPFGVGEIFVFPHAS